MSRIEFGADGIRGMADRWPLIPPIAVRIGQALGEFVYTQSSEDPFVVLGRDTRPSGVSLQNCLAAGLIGQGIHVTNLGVMTTPGVAFLTRRLKAHLGVVVSASHNSLEHNGIKLVKQNGLRLQREEELIVEDLINDFTATPPEYSTDFGQESNGQNLVELYIQDHIKRCPAGSLEGFRVVLDCANGAASRIAPEAFRRLDAEVVVLNDAMEGQRINYRCGSEYVRKHPSEFADTVQQHDAMYGFAFDGDGDRLVVVDADGKMFDGNDLLFIMAEYFLSQGIIHKGNAIVTVHWANQALEKGLKAKGIRTVYVSNGDRNLEAAMWGDNCVLGGEPGGNIIINDEHHTAADAVYTAIVLSGILANNQGITPLKKHPQVFHNLPVELTLAQLTLLRERVQDLRKPLGQKARIDFHPSTTEPGILRIMIEGGCQSTEEQVSKALGDLEEIVNKIARSNDEAATEVAGEIAKSGLAMQ